MLKLLNNNTLCKRGGSARIISTGGVSDVSKEGDLSLQIPAQFQLLAPLEFFSITQKKYLADTFLNCTIPFKQQLTDDVTFFL